MSEMTKLNHCPLCNSEDIQQYTAARDYMVSGLEFGIFKCKQCRVLFTSPVPHESQIGEYYKDESYISHSNTGKGLIARFYKIVRKRTMAEKYQLIRKHSNQQNGFILDVGAGTGSFVENMRRHGWQVLGLEPDEGARNVALREFKLELRKSEELFEIPEGKADVITLWHVLEHVHNLGSYMQQFHKILKDDGLLVLAMPNNRSTDARIYGKYWAAWDVPRHIFHFNPDSVTWLAQNFGFKVSAILPMMYDAYYVSLLSEKYKGSGRLSYFKALYQGWRSNRNARKDVQKTSSLIYILKKSN